MPLHACMHASSERKPISRETKRNIDSINLNKSCSLQIESIYVYCHSQELLITGACSAYSIWTCNLLDY